MRPGMRAALAAAVLSLLCIHARAEAINFTVLARQWSGSACPPFLHDTPGCQHASETAPHFTIHGLFPGFNSPDNETYPPHFPPHDPLPLNDTNRNSTFHDCHFAHHHPHPPPCETNPANFSMESVQDLVPQLQDQWPGYFGPSEHAWEMAWTVAGTCASPAVDSGHAYFETALAMDARYNATAAMLDAGIYPSLDPINRTHLEAALYTAWGVKISVKCLPFMQKDGSSVIAEVLLCFDHNLAVIDCPENQFIPGPPCSESLILPPMLDASDFTGGPEHTGPHAWPHHGPHEGPEHPESGPHKGPEHPEFGPHDMQEPTSENDGHHARRLVDGDAASDERTSLSADQVNDSDIIPVGDDDVALPTEQTEDLHNPHDHPDGPHAHPDGPHDHPDGPHDHPDGPHDHPDGPHDHPDGPHDHPDGPHDHPDGPHDHPGGPHDHPDGPHDHPDGPHDHPDGPHDHPDGPHDHPDGPHDHPDGPHDHPDGPHDHPDGPHEHPDGPHEHPDGPHDHPDGPHKHPDGPHDHPNGPRDHPGGPQDAADTVRDGGEMMEPMMAMHHFSDDHHQRMFHGDRPGPGPCAFMPLVVGSVAVMLVVMGVVVARRVCAKKGVDAEIDVASYVPCGYVGKDVENPKVCMIPAEKQPLLG